MDVRNARGVSTVSCWVDDGPGSNTTDTIAVTVLDITTPLANAGADPTANDGPSVSLDGRGSSDNDPNFAATGRYSWTFVDAGGSIVLTAVMPSYPFNTMGSYDLTLKVTDPFLWVNGTTDVGISCVRTNGHEVPVVDQGFSVS